MAGQIPQQPSAKMFVPHPRGLATSRWADKQEATDAPSIIPAATPVILAETPSTASSSLSWDELKRTRGLDSSMWAPKNNTATVPNTDPRPVETATLKAESLHNTSKRDVSAARPDPEASSLVIPSVSALAMAEILKPENFNWADEMDEIEAQKQADNEYEEEL